MVRYMYTGLGAALKIDHDTYHKMLEEYRAAKQKQQGDELKIRQ